MNAMHVDIEANWIVNSKCNYKCEYCATRKDSEHPEVGKLTPLQYRDFFARTGRTWLLHFSGGEPFIYDKFIELCSVLSCDNLIAINSNLSTMNAGKFINMVPPERVAYIHCAVHLRERNKSNSLDRLLGKLTTLKAAGFAIFSSIVMDECALTNIDELMEIFSMHKHVLIPKTLRGFINGQPYPESYSADQRAKIIRASEGAEERIKTDNVRTHRYSSTTNPLLDRHFLDGWPNFSGHYCSAGRDFVRILQDGSIYRCGDKTKIGSIPEGRLDLLETVTPCDDSVCPYICLRYTGIPLDQAKTLPKRFTRDSLPPRPCTEE